MLPSKVFHIKNTDVKNSQPVIDGRMFKNLGYDTTSCKLYATLNSIQFPDGYPGNGKYTLKIASAELSIMISRGQLLPLTDETWICCGLEDRVTVNLYDSSRTEVSVSWIVTVTISPGPSLQNIIGETC